MKKVLVACIGIILLSGCASQSFDPNRYSGFLTQAHYEKLKTAKLPSNQIVYRYISLDFDPQNYDKVIIEPVVAFPKPKPTENVSEETLLTLQSKLTQLLKDEVNKVIPVTNTEGEGVLRVEIAITGVDISDEGLAFYEYIPTALVLAGASKVTGIRDQDVKVFLEGKVTDSVTNEVLAAGVREISGEELENAREKLQAEQLNEGLLGAGKDLASVMKKLLGR